MGGIVCRYCGQDHMGSKCDGQRVDRLQRRQEVSTRRQSVDKLSTPVDSHCPRCDVLQAQLTQALARIAELEEKPGHTDRKAYKAQKAREYRARRRLSSTSH